METLIKNYIDNSTEELQSLLKALVEIPAPSHHEEKRAEFVKDWLESQGAKGVYIDKALNCVYPINCYNSNDIVVFCAHTDTVFPDTTPFELKSDGEYFYAPGVCDDTSSLTMMLMATKFIIKNKLKPKRGVLIVANSCEEGLGNLKGTKQIMEDYKGRVTEFYTFDGNYSHVAPRCVGSHRYEVNCEAEGGHSFGNFGKESAIHNLAKLITELYAVEMPVKQNAKTTFNVGIIEGGTSVNTIAQNAKMLYEYRSDDVECLKYMEDFFHQTIDKFNQEGKAKFTVNTVGIRPCAVSVDENKLNAMTKRVISVCENRSKKPCTLTTMSTDCNIPLSLGIPAVCVGVYDGSGEHRREEKLLISSLPIGLNICLDLMLDNFGE